MKKPAPNAVLAALLTAGAATSASIAHAAPLEVGELTYATSSAAAKVTPVKVAGRAAVQVTGPGTPVTIDCSRPVTKGGGDKTLSSVKVGIRHVDKGTHSFQVALGRAGQGVVTGSFDCNLRPGQSVVAGSFQCNLRPGAQAPGGGATGQAVVAGSFQCNYQPTPEGPAGSAVIAPRFEGSATFSVKIVKSGKVVKTLAGQKGAITIPDFDGVHDAHEETLGVTIAYGLERAGAWTMKVEHEEYTLFFTAETAQKPLLGGGQLALRTSGLETITLVDPQVAVADAPRVPPPAAIPK